MRRALPAPPAPPCAPSPRSRARPGRRRACRTCSHRRRRRGRTPSRGDLGGSGLGGGEEDRDPRPPARLALDVDPATVVGHDAVRHGEPEAGALAHVLGGEEWLEDVREGLRADAAALILDGDAQVLPRTPTGVTRTAG